MKMNPETQAMIFSALADPTRLKLLNLLSTNAPGELCVNALAEALGVTQPAVSQHLRILKTSGLVHAERRGYYLHYAINTDALERCQNLVTGLLSVPGAGQRCSRAECREKPKRSKQSEAPIGK